MHSITKWNINQSLITTEQIFVFERAVLMIIPIFTFVAVICCLDGLVIYAVYAECDLAKEGKVTNNDQVSNSNSSQNIITLCFLIYFPTLLLPPPRDCVRLFLFCLSVCLFVCLSVCLFVCLSVCLFVCLIVFLFVVMQSPSAF